MTTKRPRILPSESIKGSLPTLDNYDYESTATRATETKSGAPGSRRLVQRVVLTIVEGTDAGRFIRVEGKEAVLGRSPECALVLPDAGVSRRHARVVRRGEQFLLEDLKSKNGTFVNGVSVRKRTLAMNDV